MAGEFFRAVVEQARGLNLLSDEHFTVDGSNGERVHTLLPEYHADFADLWSQSGLRVIQVCRTDIKKSLRLEIRLLV